MHSHNNLFFASLEPKDHSHMQSQKLTETPLKISRLMSHVT